MRASISTLGCAFANTQEKRILFVTYGGGHARMLIPVIKGFRIDVAQVYVRYDDSVSRFCTRKNSLALGLRALLDRMEQKDQIANSGERLASKAG